VNHSTLCHQCAPVYQSLQLSKLVGEVSHLHGCCEPYDFQASWITGAWRSPSLQCSVTGYHLWANLTECVQVESHVHPCGLIHATNSDWKIGVEVLLLMELINQYVPPWYLYHPLPAHRSSRIYELWSNTQLVLMSWFLRFATGQEYCCCWLSFSFSKILEQWDSHITLSVAF
jgi:hypothetical protein